MLVVSNYRTWLLLSWKAQVRNKSRIAIQAPLRLMIGQAMAGGAMQDMLAQLEKLRREAAECELIRDLATDPKKRELFDRLAAHLSVLASEVERTMLESGKRG